MKYVTLNNGVKMPMAGIGDWQEGQRFRSGASQSDVTDWVSSLGL